VKGSYEVFVRPYPGPGWRWQISTGGGVRPQWSPDGRQIHYLAGRGWWVVDAGLGSDDRQRFRAGVPRLVRGDLPGAGEHSISNDGKALLRAVPVDDRGTMANLTVVVDWFTDLERLTSEL